jgi:hypothetical protein
MKIKKDDVVVGPVENGKRLFHGKNPHRIVPVHKIADLSRIPIPRFFSDICQNISCG